MIWDELTCDNAIFLLVDFQENFFPILKKSIVDKSRDNILLKIRMFKRLGIPMIGTDHYRKGLGLTDQSVLNEWIGDDFIDKSTFSCMGNTEFKDLLETKQKKVVIVSGLETHICVFQTVIDLFKSGYKVIVINDSVLSSTKLRWFSGLNLMEKAGATICTTETLLFFLLKRVGTDDFKFLVNELKKNQKK